MSDETVHIESRDAELIRLYVEGGRYASPSEVVSAGLQLLEAQDREDKAQLGRLRVEAQKGIDDLEAGRFIEMDCSGELDAYLDTVSERGLARLAEAGIHAKALEAQ